MSDRTHTQDSQLIAEYKRTGSQTIMGEIYKPYMPLVYGVCMKYLKDPSRAEDMVMEIYEHVAKKLQVHEVEAFKPWLYTVSKNKCYELLRKRNKQTLKEKTAYDVYSEAVFHPDNNDKEDKLTRMESCMETLSDVQKSCISAFYYKSKTYQMIAEEQNLSWNSVRSHIQNGRLKLKKCMEATIKKNV